MSTMFVLTIGYPAVEYGTDYNHSVLGVYPTEDDAEAAMERMRLAATVALGPAQLLHAVEYAERQVTRQADPGPPTYLPVINDLAAALGVTDPISSTRLKAALAAPDAYDRVVRWALYVISQGYTFMAGRMTIAEVEVGTTSFPYRPATLPSWIPADKADGVYGPPAVATAPGDGA